jgi:hypothetical protein
VSLLAGAAVANSHTAALQFNGCGANSLQEYFCKMEKYCLQIWALLIPKAFI